MEADKILPIAIIGMSMKLPGDSVSADSFWDLLCNARCAVGKVPSTRFNVDGEGVLSLKLSLRLNHADPLGQTIAFYHPDPSRLDSVSLLIRKYAFSNS